MNTETGQSLNVHSPYYLHLSESPAIMDETTIMLDPMNYNSWSHSMLTTLSAKNKIEFMDETISQPIITHHLHYAWKRCNNTVISWIVHSVSSSIRQSLLWMDNAKTYGKIWSPDTLKEIY